jgi:putative peptide zinc metalloprotease protein
MDAEARQRALVAWEELAAAAAELESLRADQAKLSVRAPLAGTIIDVPSHLAHGGWIAAGEPLGMVVGDGASVRAYVDEADLERIAAEGEAWFYPEHGLRPPLRLTLASLAPAALRSIDDVELASVHGGPLAASSGKDGRVVLHSPVYAATLVPEQPMEMPPQVVRGTVLIDAAPYSLAQALWRRVVGIAVRESGF